MKPLIRGKILPHYVGCAIWASTDLDGNPLDDNYCEGDIAPATLQQMRDDCALFFFANRRQLRETGASMERHAHDFWLTRNRHGAGFWDRGYGPVGDALSDAAHVYGSVDLLPCDDGMICA